MLRYLACECVCMYLCVHVCVLSGVDEACCCPFVVWLAWDPPITAPCPSMLGILACVAIVDLFNMGSGDLNSGPHAYAASTLSTEHLPSPLSKILKFFFRFTFLAGPGSVHL